MTEQEFIVVFNVISSRDSKQFTKAGRSMLSSPPVQSDVLGILDCREDSEWEW